MEILNHTITSWINQVNILSRGNCKQIRTKLFYVIRSAVDFYLLWNLLFERISVNCIFAPKDKHLIRLHFEGKAINSFVFPIFNKASRINTRAHFIESDFQLPQKPISTISNNLWGVYFLSKGFNIKETAGNISFSQFLAGFHLSHFIIKIHVFYGGVVGAHQQVVVDSSDPISSWLHGNRLFGVRFLDVVDFDKTLGSILLCHCNSKLVTVKSLQSFTWQMVGICEESLRGEFGTWRQRSEGDFLSKLECRLQIYLSGLLGKLFDCFYEFWELNLQLCFYLLKLLLNQILQRTNLSFSQSMFFEL